jgi:hypothetical protein
VLGANVVGDLAEVELADEYVFFGPFVVALGKVRRATET